MTKVLFGMYVHIISSHLSLILILMYMIWKIFTSGDGYNIIVLSISCAMLVQVALDKLSILRELNEFGWVLTFYRVIFKIWLNFKGVFSIGYDLRLNKIIMILTLVVPHIQWLSSFSLSELLAEECRMTKFLASTCSWMRMITIFNHIA